ncbi:patatin-like phospholipase family protein [Actinoplanes sp. KI2]|uniref:patatin-like phospholipase family protein n=1 Tax=Actinoplanes sp. KI2 TaxID=2983315 RepID=UPI0021D58B45|nr:patatin-like phospholipase family protein [Actinoplanes sp. KI2]MCU7729126.1 patatin-like phospholipase family protein [Actinoplanes sp. KI2]
MTRRALVLGGGGVTGVAWEIGMLTGLAAAGVDLSGADVVIGTSAGSVVGALVAGGLDPQTMYAGQLAPPVAEIPARLALPTILRWAWVAAGRRDEQRARARIGAMALAAQTVPEADRRKVIAARLNDADWPERRLLITAVDARTGEFVVFDREHGAGLVDAVGASCAVPGVWPPVTIGDRRYVDGGVRSPVNADLAAGYDRVVILAPVTASFGPSTRIGRQMDGLGARVVLVRPDRAAKRAFGRNVLDPARRAPAARAGHAQADREAAGVAAVWS